MWCWGQCPCCPPLGDVQLSPSPGTQRRRVEPLRLTTEESPLIQPSEVVVSQRPVLTAEPVLTPIGNMAVTVLTSAWDMLFPNSYNFIIISWSSDCVRIASNDALYFWWIIVFTCILFWKIGYKICEVVYSNDTRGQIPITQWIFSWRLPFPSEEIHFVNRILGLQV
jgi:hypothetical protein